MKRYTFFIEESELEAIKKLSDKTRVPISTYLREAMSDLLKKYNVDVTESTKDGE